MATPAESLVESGYINQVQPLEVVAQQESIRTYFLAQTLESTRTVPMVSAQLPIDKGTGGESAAPVEGDNASDEGVEGGEDSDESDLATSSAIAIESTVMGSFVYRGITYAVEPGGDSVAVVAADYTQLPEDFIEAQTIVLPSVVTPDGIDRYSVARIADSALASLTLVAAGGVGVPADDATASEAVKSEAEASPTEEASEMSTIDIISTAVSLDGTAVEDPIVESGVREETADAAEDADDNAVSVGITAITLPASIMTIEENAFTGAETLQYVIVSADNPNYSMYDGCLYDKSQTNLLLIPEGRLGAVRIPSTATTIPEDVSSHCAHLTSFVVEADSAASQLLGENDLYNVENDKINVVTPDEAPASSLVADYSSTVEAQMGEIIETTALFGEDYISQKSFIIASYDLGKDTSMIQCREDAAVVCISVAAAGELAYNVVSIVVEEPAVSLLSVEETQKLAADETATEGTTIGTDGCYGYDYTNKRIEVWGGVAESSFYTMLNSSTGFSGRISWTGSNTVKPDTGSVVTVKVTSYVPKGNNCAVIEGLYGISTRAWKDASGNYIANKDKKLVGFRDATTGDYVALESIYSKTGFSFSFVMPASGCSITATSLVWTSNVSLQPVTETVTNNIVSYFSVEGGYLKNEGTEARTQVDGTNTTLYFTTYSEIGSALMLPVSTPVHETDADGTNYVPAGWYDTSGGHAPVTATSACQGKTYTIKWEKRAGTWTLKNAAITIYGGVSAGSDYLMMNSVNGFDGTISWTGTNASGPQEKDVVTVTCSRYVPDTKNCAVIEGLLGIAALIWKDESGKFIADKDNQLIGFRDSGTGSFLSLDSLFNGNGFTFSFVMPSSGSCTVSETKLFWTKSVTLKPVTKQVTNKIITYFKAYPGHLTNPATTASTQEQSNLAFATYSDIGSALALPTSTVERTNGDIFVGWKNEKTNAAPPLKAAATDNGQTYISTWQTRGGFRDYTNASLQVFPKMNGWTTGYTMLATGSGFTGRISWTGSNSSAPQEGDIVTVKVSKYVPKGNNCAVKEGLLGVAIKKWGIASATNRLVGFRDCNTNSYIALDSIFDGNGFSFYFKMPATDTCRISEKGLMWDTGTASLVPVTEQVSDMIVTYYHLTPGHFELPATGAATQNDQYGIEGGTADLQFATYSKKGEPLVKPAGVPVCTDKIFTGWFTSPTSTVVAPSIATEDIQGSTFHAQWGDKATQLYHFSFNANDTAATGEMTNWSVPYPNKFTLPQATFVKAGYTVTSWNTQANGSGTTYNADTEYTARAANSTTNLYAKWTQDTYNLTFTMNGGSFASTYTKPTEYKYETGTITIPDPTRTGYTFQGWTGTGLAAATKNLSINKASDDKLGKRTAGTATYARTYTANWKANTYTVSFNANGATSTTGVQSANVTATYNASMPTISTTAPVRTGYTFGGWYDTSTSTGGTQYYTAAGASARAWNKTANTTLYARWTAKTYTVSFNANSATSTTGVQSANVTATYDSSMPTISTTKPIRTGYIFMGWYDNATYTASGATQYYTDAGASARTWNKTSNTTLYAGWKAKTSSLTFNMNSGTGTAPTGKTATYNAAMPAYGQAAPTRTGYTFGGFYDTNANTGGTQYYKSDLTSARSWNKDITTGTTLYARWTANTYTLTWNANGGTNGTIAADVSTQTYDNKLKFPSKPTRRGYAFAGWWTTDGTNASAPGTQLVDGTTMVPAANATYFARWNKVEGKVVLNAYNASSDAAHSGATFTQAQVDAYNAVAGRPKAKLLSATQVELTYDATTSAFAMTDNDLKPSLLGSTFNGWDPAITSFNPASTPSWNTASETYGQKTYTAKWSTNSYAITYVYVNQDGNALAGATTADDSALPLSFNEAMTARTLPSMECRGYQFSGWTYEGKAVTAIPDVSKGITLTATFTADTHIVSVDLTGGTQVGWHNGGFDMTYDNCVLPLPDNDDNLKKQGYVFACFEAYTSDGTGPVTVFENGDATKPATSLQPGHSYQLLNLGSSIDDDVTELRAVWATRLAVDVPESVPLAIVADTANDTLRFRDGRSAYAGETADEFAPMTFTSFTTAPVAIVEVRDDLDDAKASERTELLDRVFPGGHDSILMAISSDKSLARHRLAFRGTTSLTSGSSYLDGLTIGKATDPENGTSAIFWLGMDFGGRKAADLASGLSGDIAKLYYTVALMNDEGTALASVGETLPAYDDLGILWTAPSESGASA